MKLIISCFYSQKKHRHRYLGMENGTIKIRLPPRSAVALELFTTHIRNILEKRMFGELSITPKEDSALKLYLQLLEEEWKSFEF